MQIQMLVTCLFITSKQVCTMLELIEAIREYSALLQNIAGPQRFGIKSNVLTQGMYNKSHDYSRFL